MRTPQALCTLFFILPVDIVIVGTAALIATIVVTTIYAFVARVPYVPTPRRVIQSMIDLARLQGSERVFDLGAGSGSILIAAKRKHPSIEATGIELSPLVWLLGRAKIFLSGMQIRFLRTNVFKTDVSDADVIFLYLFPSIMVDMEDKFDRELRPGTVVISHAFPFNRREPQETLKVSHWSGKKTVRRYQW